ncbi:hypothetical protein ACLI08_03985 [Flavobacterium sp. RNTU_13]|uniref:hypothetical protein n=1 Tax=Flavobacterium sp. RNTU_13 TaxID=3375145 RepID=UPI00398843D6
MKYFTVSRILRFVLSGIIIYQAVAEEQYLLLIPAGLLLLLALFNRDCGTSCDSCSSDSCTKHYK